MLNLLEVARGLTRSRDERFIDRFETELEIVLDETRLYLELGATTAVEAVDPLRTLGGKPERLADLARKLLRSEGFEAADLMRGLLINVLARRVGGLAVLGTPRASDVIAASHETPRQTFLYGPISAVAAEFGRLRRHPRVQVFHDDQPWELHKLLNAPLACVVVDADGVKPAWLSKLDAFDAPGGYFFHGRAATIEALLDRDKGALSACAGIRPFREANCQAGTALLHVPRDALARVRADAGNRAGEPPAVASPVPPEAEARRVYAFPSRRKLLSLADEVDLITPEQAKRIAAPAFIGGSVPDLQEAIRAHVAAQVVAPRYALTFDDLRVVGDGLCFTRNGYFFDGYYYDRRVPDDLIRFGSTYWNAHIERIGEASVRCARSESIGRRVPGRSFVMTAPNAVFELFAHFALDFMPRLQLARELWRDGDQLFVSSHVRERHLRAITELFGLSRDEIQTYDRDGPATLFERAILIPGVYKLESASADNAAAYGRAMSRTAFPARLDPKRCKKVFTSRRDTRFDNPRLLLNLDAVSAFLAERGFVELVMSDFTFGEQMAIFHNADVIVGELGSSMQPIGACRPGVKLVWLFGERAVEYYTYFITHYSSSLDAPYSMVGCEQFGWSYNSHFIVNLDVLDQALSSLGE